MHQLVEFIQKFNVDQDALMTAIFPKLQEEMIEAIRPENEVMLRWKNTGDGRKKFEEYIISKFTVFPPSTLVQILWSKYTGKKIKQRDSNIIKHFLEVHIHCKKCSHCSSSKGKFHVDHIIPLYQGGLDEFSNLQFLCEGCNLKKSSKYDIYKAII